jgi:hypothetical protein
MKKIQTAISVIIMLFSIALYANSQNWDIKMKLIKNQLLPAEPIMVSVLFTNTTLQDLRIISLQGHLFLNDKICNKKHIIEESINSPSRDASGGKPKFYKPSEIEIYSLKLNYICEGLGIGNENFAAIGAHRFCYKNDQSEICVDFQIVQPIGEDAEIYSLLIQNNYIGDILEYRDLIHILKKYPTSTYSAWVLFPYLGEIQRRDPEKVKQLLEKNLYPISNSVPDPDSGNWKEMRAKDLARWQIKWSESILMNHPDFAYAKSLKLLIAIDSIVIGEKNKGKNLLLEISKEKDIAESQWAQKFLSITNF